MPSGLYLGTCERCSCHGHTEVCEPETGACQVSPPPLPPAPGVCGLQAQPQPHGLPAPGMSAPHRGPPV